MVHEVPPLVEMPTFGGWKRESYFFFHALGASPTSTHTHKHHSLYPVSLKHKESYGVGRESGGEIWKDFRERNVG